MLSITFKGSKFLFFAPLWIGVFIICFYLYLKFFVFNYWKKIKVPHIQPNLFLGNINWDFLLDKITIGEIRALYVN